MGEGGGGNLFMIDIEEDQEEDRKRYSKLWGAPLKVDSKLRNKKK